MQTSLVSFRTTDGLKLPAMLYEPDHPAKRAAIYLHGNGSSSIFYNADYMNQFGTTLTERGIAFMPFNNRGAHIIKTLKRGEADDREEVGMAYELIKDCSADIDGAIAFLRARGFEEFSLIGHSTGANKICVYHRDRPDSPVTKSVLLGGGDDTGIYYSMWGPEKFQTVLRLCRAKVDAGSGRMLVPDDIAGQIISYQSLYDTINPEGDYNIFPFGEALNGYHLTKKPLFGEFAALTRPTLVIYGDHDEFCYGNVPGCVDALRATQRPGTSVTYQIIPDADHSYTGQETAVIAAVASWL